MEYVTVKDAHVPALGFGTFQLEGNDVTHMVPYVLELGYRHIDTAQIYGNETEVGLGMKKSSVKREDIFLTTKVWINRFKKGDLQASVAESLKKLQTEYVDLLLLHWPNPNVPLDETIEALMQVREQGKTRHIGISNFSTKLMQEAVRLSGDSLVTNQVEYHPFLSQKKVKNMLDSHNMALTAYSPLARGSVFSNVAINDIAQKHQKSASQVVLRWLLQQKNVIAIPKSSSENHAEANFEIFDFLLTPTEIEKINALARPDGRLINPGDIAPEWDDE
jgi:diketogulonate reductase-like aldo/keto reductase